VGVLDKLPSYVTGIDTMMGGSAELTAGFLIAGDRPALIETGPARVARTVADGVAAAGLDPGDLAWLVVTHIHLDHAGGLGDLVEVFPNATVVVHPAGARHLVSPERLMASSARVYGELLDTVYGELRPVPSDRILTPEDGDSIDLGGRRLEILHAPGHARHHVGVFEPDGGLLFAGDGVGVSTPASPELRPAVPPPDFDPELLFDSLHRFAERRPEQLILSHFGPIDPPLERLAEAEETIRRWCETAEQAVAEHGNEIDHIEAALRERFDAEHKTDGQREQELLNGFRSNAAGLSRWIALKQRAAEG
jgi:glyoxylase-like metal-dependent hydrolase (beta-lactamase superfamily II)